MGLVTLIFMFRRLLGEVESPANIVRGLGQLRSCLYRSMRSYTKVSVEHTLSSRIGNLAWASIPVPYQSAGSAVILLGLPNGESNETK